MGDGVCTGLPFVFSRHPTPGLDRADDGLTALVNVDVLYRDPLLALATVPVPD